MNPKFSVKPALWCLGGLLALGELYILTRGAKSCGELGYGIYDAIVVAPLYLIKFPWLVALLALAFLTGGALYPLLARYRTAIIIAWVLVAIILTISVAMRIPRAPFECQLI